MGDTDTPNADDPDIQKIERDRRRREREWLLLCLLLIGDSRRHAVYAARMGHDPILAARNVWLGNSALELPGAAPILAEQMALAEMDGMKRAVRLARATAPAEATMPGVNAAAADQPAFDRMTVGYVQDASDFASRTWTLIESKLTPAIAGAVQDGIQATIRAIRVAFTDAGVTKADSSNLEVGIERQVVQKYNLGLWHGGSLIADPLHHLVGLEHVSVIDGATTTICRARNGLRLPPGSPYWRANWCPLHWGCRSIVKPLFGRALTDESTLLPSEPPAPGFGLAPFRDLGSFFNLTR